jgi:hypothetical protein
MCGGTLSVPSRGGSSSPAGSSSCRAREVARWCLGTPCRDPCPCSRRSTSPRSCSTRGSSGSVDSCGPVEIDRSSATWCSAAATKSNRARPLATCPARGHDPNRPWHQLKPTGAPDRASLCAGEGRRHGGHFGGHPALVESRTLSLWSQLPFLQRVSGGQTRI